MDELLMKDARTNSQAFYEKYKDTIDDFFAKLTEAPGANDEERREIIDKNISLYTDYRTYLDFDLLVLNSETNQVQSLAKSMNTKSGGETQTPFYISILASIANEYRINLTKEESNKRQRRKEKQSIAYIIVKTALATCSSMLCS